MSTLPVQGDQPFFTWLDAVARAQDSCLCVGLDPEVCTPASASPAEVAAALRAECVRLITATAPYAAAYKPNAAFFEAVGAAGVAVLEELVRDVLAPLGIPVLLDGKRGDIANTADAYAKAAFTVTGAHAVTVNGYMGRDAVSPFTKYADKGVFVLCKTSNPSADELQRMRVAPSGEFLFQHVARKATTEWGTPANVGLVVGATDTDSVRTVRRDCPHAWLLSPGVGAQGGDLTTALRAGLRTDGLGMLIPVSRGIARAADPAAAAAQLRDAINDVRRAVVAEAASAGAGAGMDATTVTAPAVLLPHQRQFIDAALDAGVLRFGSFTLKSGRVSPFFFNAGQFFTGAALGALGAAYAHAIQRSGMEYDVLFGPAYKGIPLVTAVAMALAALPAGGCSVPTAYNRKEAKDHGEGGTLVGAPIAGKRVLLVDDVITAGTAIQEAMSIVRAAGGEVVGVLIGLDRQERGNDGSGLSALQQVTRTYGIPVVSVASLSDLIVFLQAAVAEGRALPGFEAGVAGLGPLLHAIQTYRSTYGVTADSTSVPTTA